MFARLSDILRCSEWFAMRCDTVKLQVIKPARLYIYGQPMTRTVFDKAAPEVFVCLAQVFNVDKWTLLPEAYVEPILTADAQGMYRQDNHAWLFGWSNGTVFQVGVFHARLGVFRLCSNSLTRYALAALWRNGTCSQAPARSSP